MQSATIVKAYAALAAVCFFWGTTYLAIRIGVESIPPFLFAGVRFLIAGGLVCLYFILKKTPLPSIGEWKNIVLISFLFFVIGNSSVVHAEQRFTHHRPIVAGDELVAVLHVDGVRGMGGGAMITTRAEISTVAGDAVATTVSAILVRGEGQ